MDNSEKLINKIKDGNLKPVPRWRFALKNYLSWFFFSFAVLLGALAFSVILYAIQQVDFNILSHISHSWFEMLLGLLPFFWVVSLVIFLVAAIISIKNSRKGYKFSAPTLIGICAALSILVGTVFFIGGGGNWLDRTFEANVEIYRGVQENKIKLWTMPEDGYLSGTIKDIGGDIMTLEDFTGKTWTIDLLDADVVPSVGMFPGEKIKMIGKMTSRGNFKAENIRPWGPGERNRGRRNKK